jgi:hypothetical protein
MRFISLGTPARLALAIPVLASLSCNPQDSGPSGPSPRRLSLVYTPSTAPASCTSSEVILCAGSCSHHYAPSNLAASGSWGAQTRLAPCGTAYCGTLEAPPIGRELTVLVLDIAECCRNCSAAVLDTVFANGTRLTRFVPGDAVQAGGLVFTIDRSGVVTP